MEHLEKLYLVLTASYLRYIILCGGSFLFFYYWKRLHFQRFSIQQRPPKKKAVSNEVKYSLLTTLIFGIVVYLVLFTGVRKYTRIYDDLHTYSIGYLLLSFILTVLLHDTYFYWTHRLMHWKKIFPYVHHVHHKSHNPTPLAAFAFHPIEALIEIGILPLIVFLIPVHKIVLVIFGFYMITMNVIGHLGFEFFNEKFVTNPLTRWMNTSTHHNMHHHYSKGNYGLYFNIWDRLMKTNHAKYESEYKKVVAQRNNDAADTGAKKL